MMENLNDKMIYFSLGAFGAYATYCFLKSNFRKGLFGEDQSEIEKMVSEQRRQYYAKLDEEEARLRQEVNLVLCELERQQPRLENYLKANNYDFESAHVRKLLDKIEAMK